MHETIGVFLFLIVSIKSSHILEKCGEDCYLLDDQLINARQLYVDTGVQFQRSLNSRIDAVRIEKLLKKTNVVLWSGEDGPLVPYSVDDSFTTDERKMLFKVISLLSKEIACVRFERIANDKDHSTNPVVKIIKSENCRSFVGMQSISTRQRIELSEHCLMSEDVVMHLLLHTLGLAHLTEGKELQTYNKNDLIILNYVYCDLPRLKEELNAKETSSNSQLHPYQPSNLDSGMSKVAGREEEVQQQDHLATIAQSNATNGPLTSNDPDAFQTRHGNQQSQVASGGGMEASDLSQVDNDYTSDSAFDWGKQPLDDSNILNYNRHSQFYGRGTSINSRFTNNLWVPPAGPPSYWKSGLWIPSLILHGVGWVLNAP